MRKLTFILFWVLSMLLTTVNAQIVDTTIAHQFSNYLTNNLQEKMYVHTDKESYLAGEMIWFKLYTVEAYTNRPINLSKIAYVELLDSENKAVLQAKIVMEGGNGNGYFYLPLSLRSGNFVLRTYTNWMKNFDVNYFFHKQLTIYNTLKADPPAIPSATITTPAIQFFPEGGNLVSGLISKIAFKAVDASGKPLQFKGAITDSRNDTLVKFSPQQFGLGSFYFKPQDHINYSICIQPMAGKPFYATLPKIFAVGTVMSIKADGDSVLKISIQDNQHQDQYGILFVHSGRKVVFSKRITAIDIATGISISKDLLGDGITHFTLFNTDLEPICERLYFKKPNSLLAVTISAKQKEFSTREKIALFINQTQQGKPIATNFSIAVYQADSVEHLNDITSSLWLTSELKGKIDYPEWYLKNAASEATDLLMLTHGWRRFEWKHILKGPSGNLLYQPEIVGQIISGQISGSTQRSSLASSSVYLSIPGKNYSFYTTPIGNDGNFIFFTKYFYGRKKIIVQADPRVDSLGKITLRSPYVSQFSDYRLPTFHNNYEAQKLIDRSVAMQVHNAFNANHLKRETTVSIDTTVFYYKADKSYLLDDYVRFPKMEEVLREYVFEVSIIKRNKNYYLNTFDIGSQKFLESSPLILVDGLPLFDDGNALMMKDPKTIKKLAIVASRYANGNDKFEGILDLQTYAGDLNGTSIPTHALQLDYEGLQINRAFYAPMYDGDVSMLTRLADFRSTLFWSPNNTTKNDGKATISFFSSDFEGNYVVVVQSLSPNGGTGTGYANFKVLKKN
ncbi:hypothetical protein ACUN24_20135 [Pedobacter sp. WC2501]|uniref:hypothetical protein n=1 Tax=Pedobacter sp. WC2501 TaxID=3461400 RepID=UPI004045E787